MPGLPTGQALIVDVTQQEVCNSTIRKLRITGGTEKKHSYSLGFAGTIMFNLLISDSQTLI